MRLLNLGNLVHFIGHPVIQGFTASAAILIISKQLPLILGGNIFQLSSIDAQTTALALGFIGLLMGFKKIPHDFISKLGPLVVVIIGCVWAFFMPNTLSTVNIDQSHSIFNLSFVLPWELFEQLLPNAVLIALIGLLESTSVAKNLAKHRKETIHANQELLGLSLANLAACVFHAYPVAGGFGRSMVNHQAGASSPLAGVFTAIFVGFLLLFTIDAINYIPLAALGAIVIIAVWPLLEFKPILKKWRVQPKETTIWLVTFIMVLWQGVEIGILSGVSLSVIFLIRSAAKPHIAIIGQIPDSAHFRNIKRHNVITHSGLLAIRIDEGIHFANQDAINQFIEEALQHNPDTNNLLIVCSAVNIIDSDGLDLLQSWNEKLQLQHKQLHLAEVKGPVMDELISRGFVDSIKPGKIFLSTKQAFDALSQPSDESYII
jgi:SulP family sulfate permease